ncbi:MAG: hypothetical protein M3680_28215 [Myxococcota bacterium]|nr:hypothetical protein [Myxococcota bacterium]
MAACGEGERSEVVLGIIELEDEKLRLTVPDRGIVGTPLRVGVGTFGDHCYSFESTEVDVTSNAATVVPFDRQRFDCPLGVIYVDHSTDVVFTTPGIKTVVIRGRKVRYESDEVVEKIYTVTVEQ